MAKFGGMYDEGHKIENDGKGNAKVKSEKKEGKEPSDEKIVHKGGSNFHEEHAHERMGMHHKHLHEKMRMHEKHSMEHMHHKGEKAELHKKHHAEFKDMHTSHESEMKAMHTKHEKEGVTSAGEQSTVSEPIEKIEKGAK